MAAYRALTETPPLVQQAMHLIHGDWTEVLDHGPPICYSSDEGVWDALTHVRYAASPAA